MGTGVDLSPLTILFYIFTSNFSIISIFNYLLNTLSLEEEKILSLEPERGSDQYQIYHIFNLNGFKNCSPAERDIFV